MKLSVGYETSSGNRFQLDFDIVSFLRDDVPHVSYEEIGELCGNCKGWNGGCPGCSPWYPRIKPKMAWATVILLTIDMAWACKYSRGGMNPISSNFFRMGYADRLTDRFVWSILKKSRDNHTNFVLGCGHCPICPKKRCDPIKGGKCVRPLDRMYSLEATGIDCNGLTRMITGEELVWWYKDENLPTRMQRLAAVINSDAILTEELLAEQIRKHAHTFDLNEKQLPEKPELAIGSMHHQATGRIYEAYVNLKADYRND